MSYPCTGIYIWWTVVQSVRFKREIGENQPLQDVFSEHLDSGVASTPVGQCQLRNRTVCPAGWVEPGGMVGWGREMLPVGSGQALGTVAAVMLTRVRGTPVLSFSARFSPAGQAIRRNSPSAGVRSRITAAGRSWQSGPATSRGARITSIFTSSRVRPDASST